MKCGSGMWAMWAGGLWWIRREDRSRQAVFTADSGFPARAEDQPSCPPSPHACARTGTPAHAELGNASNADRGARGASLPRREGWEWVRGKQHKTKRSAGAAAEVQDCLLRGLCGRVTRLDCRLPTSKGSLLVPLSPCLWKQNFTCVFAINLSVINFYQLKQTAGPPVFGELLTWKTYQH